MKELVVARKEQLKKQGQKGFTLMEMLIVIAIIAVLVAIAIPVFTAQLNKARVESDAANIRSGYALATATVLSEKDPSATYGLNANGTLTAGAAGDFETQGTVNEDSEDQVIGGQPLSWSDGEAVTYTFNTDATGNTPAITISVG